MGIVWRLADYNWPDISDFLRSHVQTAEAHTLMDERRLTPWQAFKDLLSGPKQQPLVLRVYNPLGLKPADFVTVDDVLNGIHKTTYQVTEIDVYRRTIANRTLESVDYVLPEIGREHV